VAQELMLLTCAALLVDAGQGNRMMLSRAASIVITAQPVEVAAKWYADAAKGKIPNAYEQALAVLPEAMGAGGAGVVSPKVAGAVVDAAPAAAGAVRGNTKQSRRFRVSFSGCHLQDTCKSDPGSR
jgi:hypothetical protein